VRFPHNTRLAGAALALALLVGCGDTVGGTPTPPDGGATGESTEPTETSESAETTEPSETSESDPDTGELVCEGENVIAPEGQPFCFDLPPGFQQGEIDIDTQAGSSASYTTGILLSELDLVIFSVYELDLDSDDATDQQLIDALAALIDDLDLDSDVADSVTVIEWGEGLADRLASEHLHVLIDRSGLDERRTAVLHANGAGWLRRLDEINR